MDEQPPTFLTRLQGIGAAITGARDFPYHTLNFHLILLNNLKEIRKHHPRPLENPPDAEPRLGEHPAP